MNNPYHAIQTSAQCNRGRGRYRNRNREKKRHLPFGHEKLDVECAAIEYVSWAIALNIAEGNGKFSLFLHDH
jgi:hypothetical protein